MVDINEGTRTIKAKIVYYGPAVGGKTTNLRFLQDNAVKERRGMMISVNSTQERTILFDLLPLRTIGFRGYDFRLQLIGVAGQSMYAPSRKTALKDADGIVFVANSAVDRWDENLQAFGEMTQGLVANGVDISEIPFVLQYNKRDLPESTPLEVMNRGLNPRQVPSFPATAKTGEGVLESFASVLEQTVRSVARNHSHLELPSGLTPATWTQVAIQGMFGRTSFGAARGRVAAPTKVKLQPPTSVAAPPALTRVNLEPKVIRISPGKGPDDRLDSRSPEAVAESYAEASAELGIAVSEMRDERDDALTKLEEVQRSIDVAHDLASAEGDGDQGVMRMLSCLAEAAEATHATLLVRRPDGSFGARPLPPLTADPVLGSETASSWIETQGNAEWPVLCQSAEEPSLKKALESASPGFSAVLAAPVRDTEQVFAIAMLYYAGDMPLPRDDRVQHVGTLARTFCAPLELGLLRSQTQAFDRLRYLSRLGDASAAWSIAALSRGALEPEPVDLGLLLRSLDEVGVQISLEPDLASVSAPPDLIQLALVSLVGGGEAREPGTVSLRAARSGEQVRVEVLAPALPEDEDNAGDEAVLALVQWVVDTCCNGRFETASEQGTARHVLWLNPA